jgi:aspartate/tyrosine/aromatic aminotransferase
MKCMNFETCAKMKTAVIVDNSVMKNKGIYKDPIGQFNMKQVSAYI